MCARHHDVITGEKSARLVVTWAWTTSWPSSLLISAVCQFFVVKDSKVTYFLQLIKEQTFSLNMEIGWLGRCLVVSTYPVLTQETEIESSLPENSKQGLIDAQWHTNIDLSYIRWWKYRLFLQANSYWVKQYQYHFPYYWKTQSLLGNIRRCNQNDNTFYPWNVKCSRAPKGCRQKHQKTDGSTIKKIWATKKK